MKTALTFDDVLIIPNYSQVLPKDVHLQTFLTRGIKLNIPIVSSPMDTVTEHEMAISMALNGGIGIIHKNLSIEEQSRQVALVKRFENGFIDKPVTITEGQHIYDVAKIRTEFGYKKIPVVDEKGKLAGLITELDYFLPDDLSKKVKDVMRPLDEIVTAKEPITLKQANKIIKERKLSILHIVDKHGKLASIVTRKDLEKNEQYPDSVKDSQKRLRVGAAISVGKDAYERAVRLVGVGVDVLVVDTAHGHSKGVIDMVKLVKKDKQLQGVEVIAGNVATAEGAKALIEAGADGVKVGVGPGSICTTRIISGAGMPQMTALMEAVKGAGKSGVSIIADGGIKYSGDIVKALSAGAHCVMLGGLLAGTQESPGEVEYYEGRMYKSYRGMGSLEAMKEGGKDRYGQGEQNNPEKLVPEGIVGRVLYRGAVTEILFQLCGGIRSGMGYIGAKNISETIHKAKMVQITASGLKESHPHDVQITKEAPNYQAIRI
jgi:IMP dehydrogenase